MKRTVCAIGILLLISVLHNGCIKGESSPETEEGGSKFRLSLMHEKATRHGGPTRSPQDETILDNMRLYCFSQGNDPLPGNGGSWGSYHNHLISGVTRTDMTLHSNSARAGNWDLVMVSGSGAELTPPVSAKKSGEALMYTYEPGAVKADGSRNRAHEIWHRMLRLPTIDEDSENHVSAAVTRNMALVKVVVERAVDINMASTGHTLELHGVPNKISWSGTLLRTVSPGVYETSTSNPDVLAEPLTGKFAFTDNSIVETGTYKSDTLTFVVPAHREADFWTDNVTANTSVTDTISHKMSLSVSFAKASGGTFFKTVTIPRTLQCNRVFLLSLRMQDVNLEINSSVAPWEADQPVSGNFEAPYLNVSHVQTTVYDGSASRIYFWSNQPDESVYILREGDGVSDVDTVFDRIAGPTAENRHYDVAAKSGYIDIAGLNLSSSNPDVKVYLRAGSLQREIEVRRSVSAQALKSITTPYVGTFHRWNQVGERLVTWKYTGRWTAYVDDPGSGVVIDRLPSPSFADGSLYGASPSDPERGRISSDAVSVSGTNTVYFRVGWKSTLASASAAPRYASITVRQGTDDPSGTVIQKIYLRQGEKASAVYTRTGAALFSPYNLTSANPPAPVAVNAGIFTDYPSQCGAYFQWMDNVNARYAYAAYGAATPWNAVSPFYETYWTEDSPGMDVLYETCPAGYRRVDDGSTAAEPTGASELRQSLWAAPTAASATNTLSGYYADGFFDRRAIVNSATGVANSAAGTADGVAYRGRLFYNETTNASLFFPSAGQRVQSNGSLENAGAKGYYWTASSTVSTTVPTGSQAYVSTSLRNTAVNIRCVAQ